MSKDRFIEKVILARRHEFKIIIVKLEALIWTYSRSAQMHLSALVIGYLQRRRAHAKKRVTAQPVAAQSWLKAVPQRILDIVHSTFEELAVFRRQAFGSLTERFGRLIPNCRHLYGENTSRDSELTSEFTAFGRVSM